MKKFLKILVWSVLGIVLLAIALIIVTVKLLTAERLTPIANYAANQAMDADVSIKNVELKYRQTAPFLTLQVDSLTIISRDMLKLPAEARDTIPVWADTLLQAKSISGGINVFQLIAGNIYLNDITIDALRANAVIVNDSINNFTITEPSAEEKTDTAAVSLPDIRIKSFALTDLGPLRFLDMTSGTRVEATSRECRIDNDADTPPRYSLDIASNVDSPLLRLINRDDLNISIDGTINWHHETPMCLQLSDFDVAADQLGAKFSLDADFSGDPRLDSFEFALKPTPLAYLLSLVPADMVPADMIDHKGATLADGQNCLGVTTDAVINVSGRLTEPYIVATGDVPHADVDIKIADSYLRWRRVDLQRLMLDVQLQLRGNDLNDATAHIERFVVEGPATTITIGGDATQLIDDPRFVGNINGHVVIDRLPPVLTAFLDGATAKGTIDMDANVNASMSMFRQDSFHRVKVDGTVDANDLYYLSADTQTMFYARHASAKFGTSSSKQFERRRRGGEGPTTVKVDSLLTASVKVDSAQILASGLAMRVNDFSLGVGASNKNTSGDSTEVIPMGGKLEVGMFSLFTLSDTAGLRLRNLSGQLSMRRYKGDAHLPLFTLNAGIGRLSAGDNSTRFMLSDASLNARINKLPETPQSRSRKEFRRTADSIQRVHPEISPDSVYAMALAIRRRHSTGHRRVREMADSNKNEIIDWGTSPAVRSLLLDWNLRGSIKARTARLFTTSFPVRNRMDSLNIRFNNDSVVLNNVRYKAGRSDFMLNGVISNIKRAFTSRRHSPLEISLAMFSDTIDVNQLAKAFFTGAAKKETRLGGDLDDEKDLENSIEHTAATDSAGPLLIPVNLDAEFKLRANNVLYADLLLKNLTGQVLAYDGALSLHQLKAASDVGSINITALYSAPKADEMEFGMGLKLNDFRIGHFLKLMPAIDSIMPMLRNFDGIVNANVAATSDIDEQMNLVLPTMRAAVSIDGDSLIVIDEETFKMMAKWLLFKDKKKNMIDHLGVEMAVENNMMQIYPFMFDFDRYRLGVQGHNDLEMNFDYHIAVLKSPIPFKFGINIKGNPDKYKIRLGRARFNANQVVSEVAIADTTRLNLIQQFENVFRRGVRESGIPQVSLGKVPAATQIDLATDTLTAADSLYLKQQGLMPE